MYLVGSVLPLGGANQHLRGWTRRACVLWKANSQIYQKL